jgi:large subunit ribosomal protein L14e
VKANPHEVGRVVISLRGHDRGRRFLVVGLVDERYVLIADGDTRKLEHPKKKQICHLNAEPEIAEAALPSVLARSQTADSAIRKALAAWETKKAQAPAGAEGMTDKEECVLVQK